MLRGKRGSGQNVEGRQKKRPTHCKGDVLLNATGLKQARHRSKCLGCVGQPIDRTIDDVLVNPGANGAQASTYPANPQDCAIDNILIDPLLTLGKAHGPANH